ncbi:TetR/AcrR family transcriptional regulator [Conexibacter sp. JD483]|uniref:TetR/AcrR family transcriptional regulator n=1 Tax=unclassified Conexibacter TaxID=2627773 RepID=UPI002719B961|nr:MULTISPECIES: TetR/AcrR family transcriptional regulator [unclassified Conexibacter]MDO8187273.1 TetR/AcrR family transcriptional regulator [Conexibacter sp. CPCC 205706]MDO8198882.1 TetR/AcrR family transcriptional regulator [Conexibacter sp. CPCC 205762]MDR9370621.1 TetR/AcrR family transcriptional regulator [Conexibacter sp. JD483]
MPQQQRAREKHDRILDAADALLARDGAETLTTTRIAATAGVAVGSVYAYFADKESIAEALALRHWQRFADLVAATAEAEETNPAADPLGAVIETLAAGFRGEPSFRALWYGGLRTEQVRTATRPMREQVAGALRRVLAVHWPGAPAERLDVAARMIVLVGDGVLREAFRIDPDGDPTLLREGRTMMAAYAAQTLGASASEAERG